MTAPSPLLSICIPTYNQPTSLERLLKIIIPQLSDEIEIVIRDDSSNEESQKIVREIDSRNHIRYFHGKKEGLDIAILFLTREARGKYVWWIGDDVLEEEAIVKVLVFLKAHPQTSFLYVNSRQTTDKPILSGTLTTKKFSNGDETLVELVDMLGFITATIFERERVSMHLKDAERHIGSAWVCLYLILAVLIQNREQYQILNPLIVSEPRDPAKPAWYDGFTVFAINFFNILREFRGKFSNKAIRTALVKNFDGIWKGILVYRAKGYTHGLGAKTVTIPVLARYYWSFFGFWVALPLLALPRFILKFLYMFYLHVRSISRYV